MFPISFLRRKSVFNWNLENETFDLYVSYGCAALLSHLCLFKYWTYIIPKSVLERESEKHEELQIQLSKNEKLKARIDLVLSKSEKLSHELEGWS